MAAANALALGVPKFEIVEGTAPGAFAGLAPPDAIFIGGGVTEEVVAAAWDALRPLGRLVVNAVTLESEAVLVGVAARRGGELVKLGVARAEALGSQTAWRPGIEVVQWSVVKR